ncbi:hypothetical protein BZG35_13715 [Brevundimonas sp. LM2]|uniref:hypothetical protein n=1 Tax=Brevundimonas sp. LM2 TaxID=1938605 RepID=UPI000983DE33|nr:hypothetical protein [Brevundimonas sp. LM2]AQR62587.1 hypothetical protein BZG35_13715 [Brevundimonas sp. LM2]
MVRPHAHRLPIFIAATGVSLLALMLLGPMFLAYALSGNATQDERDGIVLFMTCWGVFFAGAPIATWVTWLFDRRVAFILAVLILVVAALPVAGLITLYIFSSL